MPYLKNQKKFKLSDHKCHLLSVMRLKGRKYYRLGDDSVENPKVLSDDDWGCQTFI